MRPIPPKLRRELTDDPFMQSCIICGSSQVEWDHCFTFAGRQINERWSLVPLCYEHHRGGGLDRPYTQYIALGHATDEELKKYPRIDWKTIKMHLNKKYGNGK